MTPLDLLLNATSPTVLDQHYIPPRAERTAPPPVDYADTDVGRWLHKMTNGKDPWLHQSRMLEAIENGHNVVLATGTASGKTLPMQATVIRRLLESKDATAFIFDPQKSLIADQAHRWMKAVELAGLPPSIVGEVSGNVPTADRDEIIKRSRVLIVTEDVVHAYFMRQLSTPAVRRFITNLQTIIIDEAHCREGVFGSNCAYFFRRLRLAHRKLNAAAGRPQGEFQILAASATVADPAGHLKALTGRPFTVISEEDNGAPFHGLHLLHIDGPDHGAAGEAFLVEHVGAIANVIAPHAAIAFHDDRQGVERVTARIGRDDVEPYRAGLESSDRTAIESALRDGKLAAVVATSALELGVDIPQFTVGINLGVPQTRKAFLQRVGRNGRRSEAVFAVVAPPAAFAKLGTTLREFYEGEAEASSLYLGNRIIQFQQASCLLDECDYEDGKFVLPGEVAWPEGFAEAVAMAVPGAHKPREIEHIAAQSTGSPHHDFPLRKIGDTKFALRVRGIDNDGATIDGDKAMREAYPGAVYYQRKKAYRVTDWRETSYERSIYLEPIPSRGRTSPILLSRISVSHQAAELQEGHLLVGMRGSLAEIRLHVNNSVIGYSVGGKEHLYRDLSKTDGRKRQKQRNYSTTGVVLRLDEPWFSGSGGAAAETRKQVAQALKTLLARERSISAGEVATAHSSIAMYGVDGPKPIHDAVVIYDEVPGGLRLTEPLFREFGHFLERLRRGAELAGEEALLDEVSVVRLCRWYQSLTDKGAEVDNVPAAQPGERLIYAPGSVVGVRINGAILERRLLQHQLLTIGNCPQLVYLYESAQGVTAIVPHDQVEPVGHDWRHVLWDTQQDTVREIAA